MKKATMKPNERLASLDVLRGIDLFFLVGLERVMHRMSSVVDDEWFHSFMWNFSHVDWEGFSPWDLVMPLFLFMSGVSIPFAMSRYRDGADKKGLVWRLLKRFLLLWVFGMMCQGNLLGLDPDRIYLYSNTLQTIAVGYLFAALFFVFTTWRTQLLLAVGGLLAYWGAMEWVFIDGFGGGNYTPDANLAEWVDRTVLGRFRDGAKVEEGIVVFSPWYRYTWLLSSLNFVVTVMTGSFAGQIIRSKYFYCAHKALLMVLTGIVLAAVGWLWNYDLPVIKKLWTSSMVLVSSGYCFVLMGVCYYVVDVLGFRRGTEWLRVYGMNSIVAYMLTQCINVRCIADSIFHGVEQYIGEAWYGVLMAASCSLIIYLVLWRLYKLRIFLRV